MCMHVNKEAFFLFHRMSERKRKAMYQWNCCEESVKRILL